MSSQSSYPEFLHSCLVTGFSWSSQGFSLPARSPSSWQKTSRFWRAVCHEKHFDCWHGLQSVETQRGHSTLPHLSTVSGTGRPASSQKLLSTPSAACPSWLIGSSPVASPPAEVRDFSS
uniref:Uncharacterized protein n=1 Tax=Anopheles atroparvus TaxID=41427 RepID=A0A182IJZ7_ANOAO